MTTQEMIRGNWNTIVGAIKQKFGEISNDDLSKVQGNIDQLVGLLQRKAGQTRQQVEQFLDQCCSESTGFVSSAANVAGQAATQASKMVADAAAEVGQYATDGYKYVANQAGTGYDYARTVVERRPMESVVLVAGASMLAGLLVGLSLGSRR